MKKQLHQDQSGLASLVIAILIVIILSTMITGFLQIIGHEQRRSLDRQLGSQAFYAAESGVNDARKAINNGFKADKTSCKPYTGPDYPAELSGTSNNLTTDKNVNYSCLLINQTPGSLEYNPVNTQHGSTFVADSVSGFLNTLNFSWQDQGSSTVFRSTAATSGTDFPTQGTWNSGGSAGTGILRVDLLPVNAASTSRDDIIKNARTYFLYPSTSTAGNPVNYSTTQSGAVINGQCSTGASPHYCNVTVNDINAPSPLGGIIPSKVYVRMRAIYNPVNVTISAADIKGPVKIRGAQVLIDSTGRAADVSRRIQVRIPQQDIDLPDFTIASMDTLCKKYVLFAGTSGVIADPNGAPLDTTGVCNPANW